jgi:hypothetical protein
MIIKELIKVLIKDISDICSSYLSEDEQIYYSNWNDFDKNMIYIIAAKNGWVDLLKWAKMRDYDSWYISVISVCYFASMNGHLEVLKWAKENKLKIKVIASICFNAARRGDLEMLKWAINNNCEYDISTCMHAFEYKYYEILKWLKNNGCKCSGVYHTNN